MKWLFQDARQRLRRLATNPLYAAKVVFREVTFADERFLSRITGESISRIRKFLDEPASTPEFSPAIYANANKPSAQPALKAPIYTPRKFSFNMQLCVRLNLKPLSKPV